MATLDVQVDERLVHDEEATCADAHMHGLPRGHEGPSS
jgi:hypothetical protein